MYTYMCLGEADAARRGAHESPGGERRGQVP